MEEERRFGGFGFKQFDKRADHNKILAVWQRKEKP